MNLNFVETNYELQPVTMDTTQQKFRPNPRDSNNILSKLFFTWTIPIFKMGYKKVLQMEDMYRPLKCDLSDSLGDRLEA